MADESIRLIPLGKSGKFAIVDAEDYPEVSRFNWKLNKAQGYVYRTLGHSGREYLHRFLMKPANSKQLVDHKSGDRLDNRRSTNLRLCDKAGNARNCVKHIPKTSKFKGVFWSKRPRRWISTLMLNRKKIYVGSFSDEIDAARAYDKAARAHFGEFACTNFPQ